MSKTPRFRGRNRVDATEDVVLTLAGGDARYANPDPQHCVMARCLLRDPAIEEVWVGPDVVMVAYVGDPDNAWRFTQPPENTAMIHAFDADPDSVRKAARWVAGKEVVLKAPVPARQLGTRTDSGTGTRGTGTRPNVHHAVPFRHVGRLDDE
jgi:hypothetical protein